MKSIYFSSSLEKEWRLFSFNFWSNIESLVPESTRRKTYSFLVLTCISTYCHLLPSTSVEQIPVCLTLMVSIYLFPFCWLFQWKELSLQIHDWQLFSLCNIHYKRNVSIWDAGHLSTSSLVFNWSGRRKELYTIHVDNFFFLSSNPPAGWEERHHPKTSVH